MAGGVLEVRSVNSVVICGVGDAHDDKGEEADQRGGHRDHRHQPRSAQAFQKAQPDPAKPAAPRFGAKAEVGNYCLWDGFHMVNEG